MGTFKNAVDICAKDTSDNLLTYSYSAGGRPDPEDAYVAFRGRAPKIDALLEGRGLAAA